MINPAVGVERRVGQRFAFNLPVSVRVLSTGVEGVGFTQDLSSRGAFLFTDMALCENAEIELTLRMPSEITLGESMRVRCRGLILRITNAGNNGNPAAGETKSVDTETKIGVAVCLKGYEYLPEDDDHSADFPRISAIHNPGDTERPVPPLPATPAVH